MKLGNVRTLHVPDVLSGRIVVGDPRAQHLSMSEHIVRRGEGRQGGQRRQQAAQHTGTAVRGIDPVGRRHHRRAARGRGGSRDGTQ